MKWPGVSVRRASLILNKEPHKMYMTFEVRPQIFRPPAHLHVCAFTNITECDAKVPIQPTSRSMLSHNTFDQ